MIENLDKYRRAKMRQDRKLRRVAWLNEIKRFSIPNLMKYIVIGMAGVYLLDFLTSPTLGFNLSYFLAFDVAAIRMGQLWRLVTFIIYPPSTGIIFVAFALYFYWMVGTSMEKHWGSSKFTLFYLCGMLGTMLAGLITGYATNSYINLSLFFAFAITFPNFKILLFLILPVKVKWLALVNCFLYLFMLINNNWPGRIALLLSLLNIFIFLRDPIKQILYDAYRRVQWQRKG